MIALARLPVGQLASTGNEQLPNADKPQLAMRAVESRGRGIPRIRKLM
ncbi:MAG: hypothetical protein ACRENG_12985 [bacterium]